jgi:hypothetical protein
MKIRPILLEAINIIYINTITYKCHNEERTGQLYLVLHVVLVW